MIRAILMLIFLAGCAAKVPCPPQDLYYVHYHYYDDGTPVPIPLFMPEGFLDIEDCCKTPEEYEEFIKELKVYEQKQRELEYERRFGNE